MTRDGLLAAFRVCPLVASVQASPGSPLGDPDTIVKLAHASLDQGVKALRLEGGDSIQAVRQSRPCLTIGLIKARFPSSDVYITPTHQEVEEVINAGCEVVALDATARPRPGGVKLADLVAFIHRSGRLALADCDTVESLRYAEESGCDLASTTLAGYTAESSGTPGPDLATLASFLESTRLPVLAEGRYSSPEDLRHALMIGASAVVVGAALNDPVRTTARFLSAATRPTGPIAAFDIGGTWLRFGLFDRDHRLVESESIAVPLGNQSRIDWMAERAKRHSVTRVALSTGGVLRPADQAIVSTKGTIGENVGYERLAEACGAPIYGLNDGLATAWGHACHPRHVGRTTLTLALGTGVGAGLVVRGRLVTNPNGDYPRVNDLPLFEGATVEEALREVTRREGWWDDADARARVARLVATVVTLLRDVVLPETVVLAGGVGLRVADHPAVRPLAEPSPYGPDAGLHGAAALAFWPPADVFW